MFRLRLRVNIDHFGVPHARVRLPFQEGADGRGNFGGSQSSRSNLVEQGLKEVKVSLVYQGNLNRRVSKRLGGL